MVASTAAPTPLSKRLPFFAHTAGPNAADWDSRCKEELYTRWPHKLHVALYRATGGNATAIAICQEIVERTHGAARVRGARPEWTPPVTTDEFADLLGVTVRAIQDALALLLELELVKSRPAAGHAKCYQAQPWVWESCDGQRQGKAATAEPDTDEDSEQKPQGPVVRIVNKPLLLLPGKKSRLIPLSGDVLAAIKHVRCMNDLGIGFSFEPVLAGSELTLNLFAPRGEQAKEQRTQTQNTSRHEFQVVETTVAAGSVELAGALKRLLRRWWDKALDPAFEARVGTALGDAPAEKFERHATRELEEMHRKGRKLASGILEYFARQALTSWRENHADRAVSQQSEAAEAQERREARIKDADFLAGIRRLIDEDASVAGDAETLLRLELKSMLAMPEHRGWVLARFPGFDTPENCPGCGLPLAHFAGPDKGEHGLVCQTPGCDLQDTDMEE